MRSRLFGLVLALACIAVYARVGRFDFVKFDDDAYIYTNPHVLHGLHWRTIAWAFTTGDAANYHPLTWISLALDKSLFGLRPGLFHIENLLLHIANSLLLLALLKKATGDEWPAIFAAFVFALHPTHVESVAWVTERKDVLSTFFLLLAMISYLRYARGGGGRFYAWMLISFSVSLLAKQMGVTLPFLLLLLDFWPLRRSRIGGKKLLVEKIPLALLSVAACVATFIAQHAGGTVASIEHLPLAFRLRAVPIAYVQYLSANFWPVDLCMFYPYQSNLPIGEVAGALLLLLLITAICWRLRRRRPYLIVGWAWFVIALLPVIGLVQIGSAMTADRYLYLPSVGLSIMVVWGVKQWAQSGDSHWRRTAVAGAASAVVLVLGVLAYRQTGYWRNTRTVFAHALTIINQGPTAHLQLGRLYLQLNDIPAAKREYAIAAQLAPADFVPELKLGNLSLDDPPQAIMHYQRALQLSPRNPLIENNMGIAWQRAGRPDLAAAAFEAAITDDPDYVEAHLALASLLESERLLDAARAQYQAVLKIDPENARARAALMRLK